MLKSEENNRTEKIGLVTSTLGHVCWITDKWNLGLDSQTALRITHTVGAQL